MSETLPKQHVIFEGIKMGVGTWAWGDRLYWGYGRGYKDEDLQAAFEACLAQGLTFFDTAEIYGQGRSESLLGQFMKSSATKPKIATKFLPFPWRLSRSSLLRALRGSLTRLGLSSVDLYQIHMPLPPLTIETWMQAMTEAYESGLTQAVGVSNFNRDQMQRAHNALARQGIPLASNQVEYSLLNRKIEKEGLLQLCHDLGVTCIAYSPLALGLLSGKYTLENPPQGARAWQTRPQYLQKIQPLLTLLRRIGADHAGKTAAQVALNWVICHGAIPIPGAKNREQAEQNAGALGWRLTEDELAQLDEMSDRLSNT